jgi:5-methylcytosine-specific restriction endonuclease McrA
MILPGIIIILIFLVVFIIEKRLFEKRRQQRIDYYRNVYLKSEDWKRKRYVVMKRDNWRCVYCGEKATEVHHKRYAKRKIGREPIHWLVSICKSCHELQHKN